MKRWVGVALILMVASPACGQLRIVTYNILLDEQTIGDRYDDIGVVVEAIGETVAGGVARPVDILMLQEQDEPFTTTQGILNELNSIYGAGAYARGTLATGPSFSSLRQTVIYRRDSVHLLEEIDIARTSQNGDTPPREALRAKFRPVGYGEEADFYVYNAHFKAGSFDSDRDRRTAEAINLRNDADTLGDDAHVIFLGDFNLRNDGSSNSLSDPAEAAFQTLIASGPAQAFDPVAAIAPAQWKNNFNARFVHTHGTDSQVDDRFDFQLPSTDWRDGEGLDFIDGTYQAYGNNGSTYNDPIDDGNTINFNFVSNPTHTTGQVIDSLLAASDHLPVVADYQLPAILSASLESIDAVPVIDESAYAVLSIENAAPAATAIGADELDYEVSITGGGPFPPGSSLLSFTASGSLLADGTSDSIMIPLDTTTLGLVSFTATVTTSSQGVPNTSQEFSLSYEVVRPELLGDYNVDGVVDTADYTVWRDNLGAPAGTLPNDPTGVAIGASQHAVWAFFFGAEGETPAFANAQATPAPASHLLVIGALSVLGGRRCRER